MTKEVRKETNLEYYKEELKKIFITDGANPVSVASKIANKLDKNMILRNCNNYYIEDILDWMAQPYKEPILDKVEKKYLSNIIKPFRNRVEYVTLCSRCITFFVRICVKTVSANNGVEYVDPPRFEVNTMYKNMEINKRYSLEELGL